MVLTKIPGELIADDSIATADLADNAVTTAKIANTAVTAAKLTSGAAEQAATGLKSDIALLAFKTQANGNLAKYNLVDQAVDSFEDASGVNASASTNATRNTTDKFYSSLGAEVIEGKTTGTSWTVPSGVSQIHVLVVAGGGSGGQDGGGGGGAGGVVYDSDYSVTAGASVTYSIGAGGSSSTSASPGSNSTFGTLTALGGGGGETFQTAGKSGGSGGGGGRRNSNGTSAGGSATQTSPPGAVGYGFAGGTVTNSNTYGGGGGGGSVAGSSPGVGGAGYDGTAIFGTTHGVSGWFAGGGGGGNTGQSEASGGQGGGGQGGGGTTAAADATANTGSGGGGGTAALPDQVGGGGGGGIVVLKYQALQSAMTLVSNSTTAEAVPTKADVVLTYTNAAGTATLNTDLIASVSRDNGTTYTAVTLASQGTTGGQTISSASSVDISGQPSGTSMVWKVATANQSGSKDTRINGVSLGWA